MAVLDGRSDAAIPSVMARDTNPIARAKGQDCVQPGAAGAPIARDGEGHPVARPPYTAQTIHALRRSVLPHLRSPSVAGDRSPRGGEKTKAEKSAGTKSAHQDAPHKAVHADSKQECQPVGDR